MFERLFSESGLSLDRLRVLVEIAEAGSIAAAAGDDPVRQSQFSRQLRELAEFFGVELAKRAGRTIKLTVEGENLARLAREQLRSLEDMWCECRARSEEYTLGGGDSVLQWIVTPAVARARHRGKVPAFRLVSLRTHETVSKLRNQSLDFGFVRSDAVPAGLERAPAGRIGYVLVVPRSLLNGQKSPDVAWAFQHLPIATQVSDGQFTRRLREIAEAHKTSLELALACETFTQTLAALRTGQFAGILPRVAAPELDSRAYRVIEVAAFRVLTREIDLVWNPRLTSVRPRACRVVDALLGALRSVGGNR